VTETSPQLRVEWFTRFLLDCVKNTPGVDRVQTLAEARDSKHPFGLAVTIDSSEVRWQVTGQLAPGERHGSPAPEVDGEPASWSRPMWEDGGHDWLAAVIGRARSTKVARIECWSTFRGGRPGQVGVTVGFHNGARVFVRRIERFGGSR
jgi:hypothetical protein